MKFEFRVIPALLMTLPAILKRVTGRAGCGGMSEFSERPITLFERDSFADRDGRPLDSLTGKFQVKNQIKRLPNDL